MAPGSLYITSGNSENVPQFRTYDVHNPLDSEAIDSLMVLGTVCLDNLHSGLKALSAAQSASERLWFLARFFMFTSTTSRSFLRELLELSQVESVEFQWNIRLFHLIGVSPPVRTPTTEVPSSEPTLTSAECTPLSVAALVRECKKRGIKGYPAKPKNELIEKILSWTPILPLTANERFARLAFSSWCLKPIQATQAMELGTHNESNIRRSLTHFLRCNADTILLACRDYGLVTIADRTDSIGQIATSPDLVGAVSRGAKSLENSGLTTSNEHATPASDIDPVVFEFKTYSAEVQINKLHHIRQTHGSYTEIDLGCSHIGDASSDTIGLDTFQRAADNLFSQVVPDPSYRYQLLLHSAVFECNVMFVASFSTEIAYVVRVKVPSDIRVSIQNTLSWIVSTYLQWIIDDRLSIPQYQKDVWGFGGHRASVQRLENLARSFHKRVGENGIYPPSRHIKPRIIALWNAHKGGTDLMSRIVKNNHFSISRLSGKGKIIWRFVQILGVNTYYLSRILSVDEQKYTSYREWRRRGCTLLSYNDLVRDIYLHMISANREEQEISDVFERTHVPIAISNSLLSSSSPDLRISTDSPRAKVAKNMRLDSNFTHDLIHHSEARVLKGHSVRGKPHWCAVCSITRGSASGRGRRRLGGVRKLRRDGFKSRYQCSSCRVFLCREERGGGRSGLSKMSCWDRWHTVEQLNFRLVSEKLNRNRMPR